MQNFGDRLAEAVQRAKTAVLVGLDPREANLPSGLLSSERDPASVASAYEAFCRGIVDVVAPLVPAVKPQAAFFEQLGPPGMSALANTIDYASRRGLIVILDGKRNDIGSTAQAYADAYLGAKPASVWGADALTVSPYLGDDSLEPFVDTARQRGAGVFVLVKTSNPGGGMLQDLASGGQTIYQRVAAHVEQLSAASAGDSNYGAIGAVVGATYPAQLSELRAVMPHCWFLVPGYGAQGGGARDVAGAFDDNGLGAIVNNSRGIIFAHARDEYKEKFGDARWQEAVEAATLDMTEQLRSHTAAGKLTS